MEVKKPWCEQVPFLWGKYKVDTNAGYIHFYHNSRLVRIIELDPGSCCLYIYFITHDGIINGYDEMYHSFTAANFTIDVNWYEKEKLSCLANVFNQNIFKNIAKYLFI